jgi:hypothetical protein
MSPTPERTSLANSVNHEIIDLETYQNQERVALEKIENILFKAVANTESFLSAAWKTVKRTSHKTAIPQTDLVLTGFIIDFTKGVENSCLHPLVSTKKGNIPLFPKCDLITLAGENYSYIIPIDYNPRKNIVIVPWSANPSNNTAIPSTEDDIKKYLQTPGEKLKCILIAKINTSEQADNQEQAKQLTKVLFGLILSTSSQPDNVLHQARRRYDAAITTLNMLLRASETPK